MLAGGGIETRLGDSNWLGRVEYLHYDFGNSGGFTVPRPGSVTTGNLTLDVVRGGLSYQLGAGFPGAAGTATATAMPVKAPPLKAAPGAPWTWSGFYIGGHAGYGWGHDPFFLDNRDLTEDVIFADGIGSNGFVGGLQAGANWQTGAWLGGLEVDLSGTDIRGSASGTVPITVPGITGTDTVTMSDKFDLVGSARVRLGRLFWPDVLLYGTGGLAWTRMRQTTDTAGGGGRRRRGQARGHQLVPARRIPALRFRRFGQLPQHHQLNPASSRHQHLDLRHRTYHGRRGPHRAELQARLSARATRRCRSGRLGRGGARCRN